MVAFKFRFHFIMVPFNALICSHLATKIIFLFLAAYES